MSDDLRKEASGSKLCNSVSFINLQDFRADKTFLTAKTYYDVDDTFGRNLFGLRESSKLAVRNTPFFFFFLLLLETSPMEE